MKKKIVFLVCVLVVLYSGVFAQSPATATSSQVHPPRCGLLQFKQNLIAKDPAWADRFAAQKTALQGIADNYIAQRQSGKAQKTTSISPVPIIFHLILDSAQFNQIGGTAGIAIRCDSQIAVLNKDFNKENTDTSAVPSLWKPYAASVGIHFALARKDPNGNPSPGYEIKIIAGSGTTDAGFSDEDSAFPEAKTAATGLAAWDVTKYYNVWCINFIGEASGLLGLTQPLSFCDTTAGASNTVDQEGVCILYDVLGCTAPDNTPPPNTGGASGWFIPYNLGRTLTHETGHFFEIWHPWGDDNGRCPTWSTDTTVNAITCTPGVGDDDGLNDTPPESDAVYNNPPYTITGGTLNDCCQMHGAVNTQTMGIACLSYMDYTDDDAMHMFTNMQAAAMASMVLVPPTTNTGATGSGTIGENYELTQNPSLTEASAAVPTIATTTQLNIFPNPTTGQVTLTFNSSAEILNQIIITNLLGQQVLSIDGQNKDYYSIDLSGMSKGIYFIKCNFASGSITRKLSLQ